MQTGDKEEGKLGFPTSNIPQDRGQDTWLSWVKELKEKEAYSYKEQKWVFKFSIDVDGMQHFWKAI